MSLESEDCKVTPDNAAPKCVDQIALEAMQDIWNIGNRLTGEASQKKAQIQVRIAEAINEALSAKLGRQVEEDIACPQCIGSEFPGEKRGIRCSACNGSGVVTVLLTGDQPK